MEEYIIKYETGKTGVIVTRVFIAISFLAGAIGWFSVVPGTFCVPLIVFIFSVGCASVLSGSYKLMTVYADRIEISANSGKENTTIYFDNIYHIGFLGGNTSSSNRYAHNSLGDAKVQGLILLLKDGGREEFENYEFDHLQEVYEIIRQKTNLE